MSNSEEYVPIQNNPNFISTKPTGRDLFQGSSHHATASNIAELIRSHRSPNNLIGIAGPWGSGKSNLIKIVQHKLNETHHFFFYDAWGHQEDIQRQSFLEELTEDLSKHKIIDKKEWNTKLKELLSRQKETKTTTNPRLSDGFIWTALIILLIPITQTIDIEYSRFTEIKHIWKMLPLLVAFIGYFIMSYQNKGLLKITEIYSIYRELETPSETLTTIREIQPSVTVFRKWIDSLSRDIKNKELVVVFDNIDRLPSNKVRDLWSSINTFFADEVYNNLWIIIPYDKTHLESALSENDEDKLHFIRKSFSVIYRVAPPVLSDWHDFFQTKFEEANFGVNDKLEIKTVRRLYNILTANITPRSIIAFINELVAARLILCPGIQLRYIALFELRKESILASPVEQILQRKYLKKVESIFPDKETLDDNMAAQIYQIAPTMASQVTLAREVENSLNNLDHTTLSHLSRHSHFYQVLGEVIRSENLEKENAILTISNGVSHDNFLHNDLLNIRIWNDIVEEIVAEDVLKQKVSEGERILVTKCSKEKCVDLIGYLIKSIEEPEEDFSGSEYYLSVQFLEKVVKDRQLSIDLVASLQEIIVQPYVMIQYLSVAQEQYLRYPINCNNEDLENYVIDKVPDSLEELYPITYAKDRYTFYKVLSHIEGTISAGNMKIDNIDNFYKLYMLLSRGETLIPLSVSYIGKVILEVSDWSRLPIHVLAMRLALGKEFEPIDIENDGNLASFDADIVHRVATVIEYYSDYGSLLLQYLDWPQPLMKDVLCFLTSNPVRISKLDICLVLHNYGSIRSMLDLDPEVLLLRLDAWSEDANKLITDNTISEIVVDAEFYEGAVKVDCALTNHLLNVQADLLRSLSRDDWKEVLENEESLLFKSFHALLKSIKMRSVPNAAISVYKSKLLAFAKGSSSMENRDFWDTLYLRTAKSKLSNIAMAIRNELISSENISEEKFLILFDLLKDGGNLAERSGDVVRHILFPVLNSVPCKEVMCVNADTLVPIIQAAWDDASEFKVAIEESIREPDVSSDWLAFAKAIGLNV